MNPPFTHMQKRPAGEDYMVEAFLGFVHWAETKQELLSAYREYLEEGEDDVPFNYHDWLVIYVWGEEE